MPDFMEEREENKDKTVKCHISQVLQGQFFQIVSSTSEHPQSHISKLD